MLNIIEQPNLKSTTFFTHAIKKFGYLSIFVLSLLPLLSFWCMERFGNANFWAYLPLMVVFLIIPVVDFALGRDSLNLDESDEESLSADLYYSLITLLCVPICLFMLGFAMWVYVTVPLTLFGKIGWILSTGMFASVLAINAAHELMHKVTTIEPLASGFLLSLVCFSGFKIEHISGHHVHVSTPKDYSSAPLNQSLYGYLVRALSHNFFYAFVLEKKRLNKKGLSAWHWRNELIWWQTLSIGWAILSYVVFGWLGVLFFFAQSFTAIVFLEIINYVEHYGLQRKLLKNGKYEAVTPRHSWNSNYLLTNLLLFQLQRHSDHHAYPKRRYQILRHHDESPQLPFGYPTMMLLAMFPPLFRRIMNPLVISHQEKD